MESECEQTFEITKQIISIGIPVIAGLCGVFLGAWLNGIHAKKSRKHAYIENQLSKLYSPLLGIRKEIEMLSQLRNKIQDTASSTWKELCAETREKGGAEALQKLNDEKYTEFGNIIEYDNKALQEHLLPLYKQMIFIFRKNMWLSEPETIIYFQKLLEFSDIWDRWLNKSLPIEVWEKLNHSEENLQKFYQHIEKTHSSLTEKMASGEV